MTHGSRMPGQGAELASLHIAARESRNICVEVVDSAALVDPWSDMGERCNSRRVNEMRRVT